MLASDRPLQNRQNYTVPASSLKQSKYAFMSMLLLRVLNLEDEQTIVSGTASEMAKLAQKSPPEILPQIAVPPTLWLQEDVVLHESKIKVALLREINGMLQKNVQSLSSEELFLLDDTTLMYYEKLLNAYDFLKFNKPAPSFDAFREDDEYEDYDDDSSMSAYPSYMDTNSGRTSISESARPGSFARSVSSGSYKSRMSTLSKDFRKLSFLKLNGHEDKEDTPPSPISPISAPQRSMSATAFSRDSQGSRDSSSHNHRDQLNALLSKSKFYNKLRRRDSTASYSSAVSTPTSVTSNASNPSTRRKSSSGFGDKKSRQRLTESQKQENQRNKLDYYVQVKELEENTKQLVGFLGKPGSRASLVRLMDFVKNNVFRLVLIDVSSMIVEYTHLKASRVI
ncbi:hypothetical protein ACI3LY_000027 [Candidozyma auris]|uniref:Uncharacterized protein n=2 Tax=Candidozyma auris TaxID=498019 RepID=A0AB36WFK1_CANAR|nr:hypothetical protein QG37_03067 [[Candida] auris]PIS57992.1 hypothetical protein CJI97_001048 [[Candida] auris]PIS58528.1 hypothetical protein B9J08_001028 [[Candida] auris]QWW23757.1 hypothetical protein CA7LBN_002558 [[Candida] auris]